MTGDNTAPRIRLSPAVKAQLAGLPTPLASSRISADVQRIPPALSYDLLVKLAEDVGREWSRFAQRVEVGPGAWQMLRDKTRPMPGELEPFIHKTTPKAPLPLLSPQVYVVYAMEATRWQAVNHHGHILASGDLGVEDAVYDD